jgi:hypothetical protein
MQNNKKGGKRVHLKQVCFWLSDQAKNYKMTITSLISFVKNPGKRGKNQGTHKTIMIGIIQDIILPDLIQSPFLTTSLFPPSYRL